jgi:GNAT superfamily N-acetyltransferase
MAGATIREATPEDIPELARPRWDIKVELGDVNPVMEFEPFARRFTAFAAEALADPSWRAFVAEAGGHLVGNLWIQLVPKVPAPSVESEAFGYITNVYVEPALRDGGLGGALLEAATEWALQRPVEFVVTWPSDRSRPFYDRAGFRPAEDSMSRRLRPEPYGAWPVAE